MGRKKKVVEEPVNDILEDEDDWDDEDEYGVPSGCRACGGPYPDCMTSCSIFDD